MAQYYPIVVQAGRNLAGDSLGFHAYSLRLDNCTNQWYLEETSMAYIPPYSLGLCLRLYGTGVAILLNSAPIGQPQLAPITGEQVIGVYSDQLRTEVAASPIRQFTLVQSVSDLTQGAQPALPPVGVTRLWAANNGDLHYVLANGTDATLLSTTNYSAYVGNFNLGGDLFGTVSNGHVAIQSGSSIGFPSANAGSSGATLNTAFIQPYTPGSGYVNIGSLTVTPGLFACGNANMNGNVSVTGGLAAGGTITTNGALGVNGAGALSQFAGPVNFNGAYAVAFSGQVSVTGAMLVGSNGLNVASDITVQRGNTSGYIWFGNNSAHYLGFDGTNWILQGSGNFTASGSAVFSGSVQAGTTAAGTVYYGNNGASYIQFDGSNWHFNGGTNYAFAGTVIATAGVYGQSYLFGPTMYFNNTTSAPYIQNAGTIGSNNGPLRYSAGFHSMELYSGGYAAVNAASFNVGSSQRHKRNIRQLDDALAIVRTDTLHGVRYRDTDSGEAMIGFVAEPWLPIAPELVWLDDDGQVDSLNYGAIAAVVFEALKQTNARLDQLEARV